MPTDKTRKVPIQRFPLRPRDQGSNPGLSGGLAPDTPPTKRNMGKDLVQRSSHSGGSKVRVLHLGWVNDLSQRLPLSQAPRDRILS